MKLIEKSLLFLLPFGAVMVAITMQAGSVRAQQASAAGQNDSRLSEHLSITSGTTAPR